MDLPVLAQTAAPLPGQAATKYHSIMAGAPGMLASAASARRGRTAAAAGSSDVAGAAPEGRCPLLASLPAPPKARMFIWDRIKEIIDPPVFQRAAMKYSGESGIVYLPRALAIPAQYLVGTKKLGKRVLAEADGEFVMASAPEFIPIGEQLHHIWPQWLLHGLACTVDMLAPGAGLQCPILHAG